jgi:hypothetical protein
MSSPQPRGFDGYLGAQQANLEQVRRLPEFSLVELLEALYDHSVSVAAGRGGPGHLIHLLVICHHALLSAGATIARAVPNDATGITRRAIEAARLAAALKYDERNLERWASAEARLARWEARRQGKKPKRLSDSVVYPPDDPLVESLGAKLGTLSDSSVHFTPEFFSSQRVRVNRVGAGGLVYFQYFEADQRELERSLLFLAAIHLEILQLFDACFDGAFHTDPDWLGKHQEIARRAELLVRAFQNRVTKS